MKRRQDGTWTALAKGDWKGKFYTFEVTQSGTRWKLHETPGIFATAVGVNGKRAAIIDLSETDPEGWAEDAQRQRIPEKDAIIYEVHMRDFSVHPSSGIKNKGKFLAFTEHGTLSPEGLKTGIDHLVEMGVTHVQILPMYDYASVDESQPEKPQYNWGYDPQNYNVPEGSYSTNAADPMCRIREMKMMVKALHDAGIGVIMDVVYNHTFDVENSPFTQTCPDYFYRMNEKGELGNDAPIYRRVGIVLGQRVSYRRFPFRPDGYPRPSHDDGCAQETGCDGSQLSALWRRLGSRRTVVSL